MIEIFSVYYCKNISSLTNFFFFTQLWDYRYSHCIGMYKGHDASISSLKYSPDGLWIASGDEGGSVKVSDLQNLELNTFERIKFKEICMYLPYLILSKIFHFNIFFIII